MRPLHLKHLIVYHLIKWLFLSGCIIIKSHELSCKATASEARHIKDILTNYEQASSHVINFIKSVIAFSANTSPDVVSSITTSLGVYGNIGSKKYLGLPSMVGRSKKAIFEKKMSILER